MQEHSGSSTASQVNQLSGAKSNSTRKDWRKIEAGECSMGYRQTKKGTQAERWNYSLGSQSRYIARLSRHVSSSPSRTDQPAVRSQNSAVGPEQGLQEAQYIETEDGL